MSFPNPSSTSHHEPAEIPFDQFDRMDGPTRRTGRGSGNAVRLVLLLFVLAGGIVGLYAAVCLFMGPTDSVYLVNGTNTEYSITLGGQTFSIRGEGHLKTRLNPGVHVVNITSGPFAGESMQIEIDRPFWSRPMHSDVYVINPDRTAIIMWEKIPYYDNSTDGSQYHWTSENHIGQTMYTFDGIDFAFKPAPARIDDPSAARVVYRERVSMLTDQEGFELIVAAYGSLEEDEAQAWFERLLQIDPTQYEVLNAYVYGLDVDAAQAYLDPLLEARPVNLAAHQAFYDLCYRTESPTDLVAMYRDLMQREPDEPAFVYMLALVEPNYAPALALMQQCVAMPDAPLPAYEWLIHDAMHQFNFEDVLTYATAALARDPQHAMARSMRARASHARGQYDAAIEDYERVFAQDLIEYESINQWTLFRLCSARMAIQQPTEAQQAVVNLARRHLQRGTWDPAATNQIIADVEAMAAYLRGDLKDCTTRLVRGYTDYSRQFLWAMLQDDFDTALLYLRNNDYADEHDALSLLLAAELAGDVEVITEAQAAVDDWFEYHGPGVDDVRRGIAGDSTVTIEQMADDAFLPFVKAVAFTIIGIRNESLRDDCFRLAKEMSYDGLFPMHLIDEAIQRYD